jgi:pimeloyl-ACP methyl ester carboxylesterase
MTQRCFWFPVVALVLLLLAIVPPTPGGAASQRASSQHLYIVFLPGMCGPSTTDSYCNGSIKAAARGAGTFRTLIAQLAAAKIKYTPIYYSYRVGSATYSAGDTRNSIARDVSALEGQMRAVYRRDASARFVLVAHSLGGVVAASWAVTNGRDYGFTPNKGLLRRTLNIVTFDSPVKGIFGKFAGNPVVQLFTGTVWYSLQVSSETIKEITYFPNSWWKNHAHLHTIANSADQIVPPTESLLGDKKLVFDSHCSTDLFIFKTCHGAVLSDVALNHYVACHWITGPYACSPPPTATPTRVPTATSTPTTTATPTPSPSGTGTPDATAIPPPPPAVSG